MRIVLALLLVLAASGPLSAETATLLTLDASLAPRPGLVPEAVPRRLTILEDGTVFVGGTRDIATGRLEKNDLRALEKRLDKIRKQALGSAVSFGPGAARYHLVVSKGRPLEVTASGDPEAASFNLRMVASLVADLSTLTPPGLQPYVPAFYAVKAVEGSLPGGCRSWNFPVSLEQCLAAPQPLSAAAARDWPTGGVAASVCANDKSYVVTLRPLLPGERP
jgi:hypothetical protein